MQGYFQRVFLPGVASIIDEERLVSRQPPKPQADGGGMRLWRKPADVTKKQDPVRRFVRDNIGALIDPAGCFEYLALYDMNFSTRPGARPFSRRIARVLARMVGAHGGNSAASSEKLAVGPRCSTSKPAVIR